MEKTTFADSNLVNLSEAARRLGVTKVTIWRWVKKGKVAPVRILGLPYLTIDQLELLALEKNKKNNQTPGSGV